jgi:hypothetical protein
MYTNQQATLKKSIPQVISVIHVICTQEYGPPVSSDLELTIVQLFLVAIKICSQSIECNLSQTCTPDVATHSWQGEEGPQCAHGGILDQT